MGRQGGQGKGKPKLKDRNFGKTLIKRQAKGYGGGNGRQIHDSVPNMLSILDAEINDDDVEVYRVRDNDWAYCH